MTRRTCVAVTLRGRKRESGSFTSNSELADGPNFEIAGAMLQETNDSWIAAIQWWIHECCRWASSHLSDSEDRTIRVFCINSLVVLAGRIRPVTVCNEGVGDEPVDIHIDSHIQAGHEPKVE